MTATYSKTRYYMVLRKKEYSFRNVPAIQNTQVQLEHRALVALAESPVVF